MICVICYQLGVLRTRGEVEERERVSEMGVVRFPRTPAVWTYRLDLLIQTNADLSTLMQCLDKALTTVRESVSTHTTQQTNRRFPSVTRRIPAMVLS